MDLKKLFKGFISLGAIYYTALSTVIILIATALSAENASKLLSPKQFLFLLQSTLFTIFPKKECTIIELQLQKQETLVIL